MRSFNAPTLGSAFAELKAAIRGDTPETRKDVAIVQLVSQDDYFGKPPKYNAVELAKLYDDNPHARTIVSKISESVAKQRWYLEKPNGDRVDDHPALSFIRTGCAKLRGRRAMKATQVLIELQGECFWIIGRNAQKEPVGFAPVPSHWVLDTPGKTINGFRIQPRSGVPLLVDPEDVIYFREPDPRDPYGRGSSLANAARVELESDQAAATFLNSFFANRARPDFILSGSDKAPLNDKDAARLEERLNEKLRGAKRAGRPLIASNEIKLTPIASGLRDNQATEVRQFGKETIAEIWNMPPELLGRLDSSNKATIDNAEQLFNKYLIDPRLAFIEDHLQPFIEANFDLGDLDLKYESPIKDDVSFALECVKARSTAFSDNEVRKFAGLKPVDGKDEFPTAPIDPNSPEALAGRRGAAPDDEPEPPKGGKKPKPKTKVLSFEDIVTVSDATDDPHVKAEVSKLFDEILAAAIQQFGVELVEKLGSDADFQVFGRVAEFIAAETPNLITQIDATTRKELLASLTEGVAASEAVEDLIKRIEAIFEDAASVRGSTIGDTLATKVTGFASLEATKQGEFSKKKWLSTRDGHVRNTHRSLDGQIKRTDEKFVSPSGAMADHPGAFGKASEDINCRCAMRPVLEGEKAAELSDHDFEVWYETKRAAVAERIAATARTVFAGQKAVVLEVLKRVGGVRT